MNFNTYYITYTLFTIIILVSYSGKKETAEQREVFKTMVDGSRANIIYFITDDEGYRDVGYVGHPDLKTRNIDAVAQNGTSVPLAKVKEASFPDPFQRAMMGVKSIAKKTVLYLENFESYASGTLPSDWWIEGCETVFVENGHLLIKADPVKERGAGYGCTIWNKEHFSGDVQVEFDAHVVASSIEANNINFFLNYTHPKVDSTIYGTRNFRLNGNYSHYHELNGYIFTFVNTRRTEEDEARFRMRRCPGFELIDENFTYHNRDGETYHVTITKQGNNLTYAVDGKEYLHATDSKYNWEGGVMGFRTFHTDLWIDNLKVIRPQDG